MCGGGVGLYVSCRQFDLTKWTVMPVYSQLPLVNAIQQYSHANNFAPKCVKCHPMFRAPFPLLSPSPVPFAPPPSPSLLPSPSST